VRLDFAYDAPDKNSAEALKALLQDKTDYEVATQGAESLLRKSWTVVGTTKETIISPEVLDQWVTWMVIAGKEKGCDFDGWGTEVP
jgi:hypothetical protein